MPPWSCTAWSQTYVAQSIAVCLARQASAITFSPATCRRGDVVGVGAGDLDLPPHLDQRWRTTWLATSGLPKVSRSRQYAAVSVEAAGRDAVAVDRQRDPLDHELLGDLGEAGVLLADQVGDRDPDVGEAELGGVGAVPAHLVSDAVDGEAGRALLDDEQAEPPWPGPPVRTAVVTKSARTPEVMKVLVPLTT